MVNEGEKILNKSKVPVFRYPERAIKAIALMWKHSQHVNAVKYAKKSGALPPTLADENIKEITGMYRKNWFIRHCSFTIYIMNR
mgnify:CR=1 FL=1